MSIRFSLGSPDASSLSLASLLAACVVFNAEIAAATVTGVTAPNLTRPMDGVLYPFSITVNGTYSRLEARIGGQLALLANYYDNDPWPNPDDPIHVPGPMPTPAVPVASPAGTPWTAIATFRVGCTVEGTVFGTSGNTGEGPVMNDGYFHFPWDELFGSSWGCNTVTCEDSRRPGHSSPNQQESVSYIGDYDGDGVLVSMISTS